MKERRWPIRTGKNRQSSSLTWYPHYKSPDPNAETRHALSLRSPNQDGRGIAVSQYEGEKMADQNREKPAILIIDMVSPLQIA